MARVDNSRRRVSGPTSATQQTPAYRPIAELPDVTFRYVVLYNDCNGPYVQQLVLEGDAEDVRDMGCWTHFILLPERA